MRLVACLALVLLCRAPSWAQEPEPRPVLLVDPAVSSEALAIAREKVPGAEVFAAPPAEPEPAAEAFLSEVRPLYRDMSFKAAAEKLDAAEEKIIGGTLPSPARLRALAEIELWMGALLFLDGKAAEAQERFQLAARLAPGARPDKIFPPEVLSAYQAAVKATPPRVPVALRVAPAGARLWLNGALVKQTPQASPGLHYVVVERADRKPVTQMLRVTRAAPEIAVNLAAAAAPDDALRQAAERLRVGALGREEAAALTPAVGRTVALVAVRDGRAELETPAGAERAISLETVRIVAPPPPPPKKPVWKRGWFWGVMGATVLVVAGAATGAAVAATAPRDYVVEVR